MCVYTNKYIYILLSPLQNDDPIKIDHQNQQPGLWIMAMPGPTPPPSATGAAAPQG